MLKIVFLIIVICLIGGVVAAQYYLNNRQTAQPSLVASPQTLDIPSIKVHARIESVGLDRQGLMDVPKDPANVAWYNLGPKPGERGNSVIDGHIDTATGALAVFAKLKDLQPGNKIVVTDIHHRLHIFVVKLIESVPTIPFPLQKVFGSTQQSNLNLITCAGSWDSFQHTYNKRLVVFASLSK